MPSTFRLLALFAHPDDEILGLGGALAHYARQGVHVELVVATRGEAGEIADPTLATPETLPQVREQEMLCSAQNLGIARVTFLGYRDSGMAGTEDNTHPHAYINARPEEVVPQLVTIIRRVRPHVILTFEPFGGYGHPDHVTIHNHTHLAISPAADPDYRPELGRPWSTSRLFYPIVRAKTAQIMKEGLSRHGLDTTFFDVLEERRHERWPDDLFHFSLDVSDEMAQKLAAFRCHQTQFGPNSIFQLLSPAELADMLRHEYFALAWPEPEPGLRLAGLFDGLVL